jgi:hypothetical protein
VPVTVIKGNKPVFYVHNADLGTYGRLINPDLADDVVDVAAWVDGGHRSRPGLQNITAQFRALFDDTSTASHAVITDLLDNERAASVYVDGDASSSPGIGLGSVRARNYAGAGSVGDVYEVSCELYQQNTWDTLRSLEALATYTAATATGSILDDGASNTSGVGFYVHVMSNSASGGNAQWIVEVHHSTSTTAASFATLTGAVLTVPSGTATGTVLSIASGTTVNRYTRVKIVRDATSGNLKVQAGLARR